MLFAGGISLILLGLFYLVIDVWGYKKWAFGFIVIGSNAIVAYMLPALFLSEQSPAFSLGGLINGSAAGPIYSHSRRVLRAVAALFYLYRNKTFVKI